ncbi:MAG: FAD-binding oxidoreductase, partial [Gammaproteobacteria bacterium]
MNRSSETVRDLVAELLEELGPGAILTDPADRWTYGYDNSKRQEMPAAVALPDDHQGVVTVVGAC